MPIARYNVYAGATVAGINYATPVAQVNSPALSGTVSLAAGEERFYVVRTENDAGEGEDSNWVHAQVDGAGHLIGPRPNPPLGLSAVAIAGGKIRLQWGYSILDQEVAAATFRVYGDAGSGTIDHATVLGTVTFSSSGLYWRWESEALTDGTLYQFGVRAVSADGVEEQNTDVVASATADSSGPPPIEFTLSLEDAP